MFGRLFLTVAITLQSILPVSAADGQFIYRSTNSGLLPLVPSQDTATPDIADQAAITFGTVGTTIPLWSPKAPSGWPSAVVDKVTRKAWTLPGTTYSANHDLSQFGLSFDSMSGSISGTLLGPFDFTDYAITVTANGRSDTTAPFRISAAAIDPSGLSVAAFAPITLVGNVVYDGSTTNRKPIVTGLVGTPSWYIGDLPAGLVYSPSTGVISGSVTDSSLQGQQDVPLTVSDSSNGEMASATLSIDIRPPFRSLDYTGSTLQEGVPMPPSGFNIREVPSNRAYDTHGLTWSMVSGSIPAGVTPTVDGELFTFSGVPAAEGNFTSIWKATDANGWSLTLSPITFTVAARDALFVSAIPATTAVGNRDYTAQAPLLTATATNLAGTPTWSATGLPTGLAINPTTGAVTGKVSDGALQGDHDVTISVVDTVNGKTASTSFKLTLTAPFTYLAFEVPPLTQQVPMTAIAFNLREIAADGTLTVPYRDKGVVATLEAGSLPPGINATIVNEVLQFSGSASEAGNFASTWKVADANGWSLSFPEITLKVNPRAALSVSLTDEFDARGDRLYDEASPVRGASANGLLGTATWSATGLPAGLTIVPTTGEIVGSVTDSSLQGVAHDVTVTVTDSADSATASKSVVVTVTSAISLLSIPYTGTALTKDVPISAQGFNVRLPGNYQAVDRGLTASLVSGSLPPGMALSPRTATSNLLDFTGNPSALGTYTSVWKVTDMYGWDLTTNSVTFTVDPRSVALAANIAASSSLRGDWAYTTASPALTATVSGLLGTASWTASGLPAGLTMDTATGKVIGNVADPSLAGDHSVTVKVTDSADGAEATKAATLTVLSPMTNLFAYTGASVTKDVPVAAQGFDMRHRVSNEVYTNKGMTVSLVSGSLPPGMTFGPRTPTDRLLDFAGTPTAVGTYTSVWKVTDVNGWQFALPSVTFTVVPRSATLTANVAASTTARGDTAYTTSSPALTATVSGLMGTASWTATGLPTGLTMVASTGKVTGTVASNSLIGTYNLTVTVTDSADGATATKAATLIITSPMTLSGTYTGTTMTRDVPITAQGFNVRYASTGAAYTSKGLTVSLVSGSLPPGIAFAPASGTSELLNFTGTPTTVGTYTSTWKVRDSKGFELALPPVTFVVNPRSTALTVNLTASFNARGEQVYTDASSVRQATAGGLIGTATWSATGLPAGLSISSTTGIITGTITNPSAVGVHTPTVTVVDSSDGATASKTVTLTVTSALSIIASSFTGATVPKDVAITAAGYNVRLPGNYAANNRGLVLTLMSGSIAPGLTFAPTSPTNSNVVFTGTPTTAGTYTGTWKVTDMYGWEYVLPTVTYVVTP